MRENRYAITLHKESVVDTDRILMWKQLKQATIVGVSMVATVTTGSPTGITIDIQDDGSDVITALAANTALTPGTWISKAMGGTEEPVHVAAGSVMEVDLNLAGGSTPQAVIDVVIWLDEGE